MSHKAPPMLLQGKMCVCPPSDTNYGQVPRNSIVLENQNDLKSRKKQLWLF